MKQAVKQNEQTKTVSGMLNIDVMNFVECPECCADEGLRCIRRGGKRTPTLHEERIAEYKKQYPQFQHLYAKGGLPDFEAVRKANEELRGRS